MQAAVGLCISHDLEYATSIALEKAEKQLNYPPSLVLYFTGSHSGGTKTYEKAMRLIKEKYPDVPLSGCSGIGMANQDDYGMKGAGIMILSGIRARSHVVKRFRIGNALKTRKVVRKCSKITKREQKQHSNTSFIFFPPGIGFPKFLVNLLNHKLDGFNPFFLMNNRIWKKFPILSRISGKFAGLAMNIAGIGISYTSAWNLFEQLNKRGIHYSGTFGADPLSFNKSYQFCNYKAYKDSLTYVSISSPELEFTSRSDTGAEIIPNKPFSVDAYLDGGFIPRINGQWGSDALIEMFDQTETPEALEQNIKKSFYFHAYRPVCVIDESGNKNLYAVAVNPNLKQGLITAPTQIVNQLKSGKSSNFKAFLSDQSRNTIEELLEKHLEATFNQNTAFGLIFDCGNRAMVIGDRFQEYMDIFSKHLKNTPYLVIISGGEVNSQQIPIVNFTTVSHVASKKGPTTV